MTTHSWGYICHDLTCQYASKANPSLVLRRICLFLEQKARHAPGLILQHGALCSSRSSHDLLSSNFHLADGGLTVFNSVAAKTHFFHIALSLHMMRAELAFMLPVPDVRDAGTDRGCRLTSLPASQWRDKAPEDGDRMRAGIVPSRC